jgi:hypothetical protein
MRVWKADFGRFWPKGQRFYPSTEGIMPGEVALINGQVGGLPMDTGMLVLYADTSCFTLMTPRGHVFSSWITFSSDMEEKDTYAQVQMLLRAGDPIFATIMRLGGFRYEDRMWQRTLYNLAAHFGSEEQVEQEIICLDPRLQWRYVTNVWYNAGFRSLCFAVATVLRRFTLRVTSRFQRHEGR